MPPGSIDDRQREILTAVVETFISTGEPVGSRTLARSNREGLSPATIRNVMADLAAAARFINENFRGWTMEAMRVELARRLEQERSEYDRLMTSLEQLYRQGALEGGDATQAVYVEGAANLVSGQQDRQHLQDML